MKTSPHSHRSKRLVLEQTWTGNRRQTALRPHCTKHAVIVSPFYMGGAEVPSDHLGTITKNTTKEGKLLSCGYASADKYQ